MAVTTVTTTMAGAINYTVVTDTSADWPSVANSTYFYDKADKLVHYKNSAGVVLEIFGVSGLTYFTEAQSTAAPNATVNVDSLTAAASSTNADAAIVPKGAGALLAAVPDNLTSGGNKRGQYAVDWQLLRNANTQVASGNRSIILGGYNNRSAGDYSITGGESNNVTGTHSVALGAGNFISGNTSFAGGSGNQITGTSSASFGVQNTVSRDGAFATGTLNTISTTGGYQLAMGYFNTASGNVAVALGFQNTASGSAAVGLGQQNTASGGIATALGQSNIASGGVSLAAGYQNNSTGSYSTAVGYGNTSGGFSSIALGTSNSTAYDYNYAVGHSNTLTSGPGGNNSYVFAFGLGNTVNAPYATAIGCYGLTNGVTSRQTFSPNRITTNGDSQKSTFFYRGRTTDATLTTIATDGSNSINIANCMQLANNNAIGFTGTIVGKQSGSTNAAMWKVEGLIVRGASAAATTLVTSTVTLVSNAPAWGTPVLSAYIDAFNGVGALRVQIQGAAATNIQWTGIIETTEVIYA